MKKLFLALRLILVLTVALYLAATGFRAGLSVAAAAEENSDGETILRFDGYYLKTLVDSDGLPYGVGFYGYYFGTSGIAVSVEIYSQSQWNIDFFIGAEDYVEPSQRDEATTCLTEEQTAVKNKIVALFAEIDELLNNIDLCVNTQYDGTDGKISDIYRYNAATKGDSVEISRETFEMLTIAREMYVQTDGAFNPAVYRLVDLWGFSSRIYSYGNFGLPYDREVSGEYFAENGYPLPDDEYVEAFSDVDFLDFSDSAVALRSENGRYFADKNVSPVSVDGVEYDQWLDLGGIAKGYAVDEIKALLEQNDASCYYVDAGTSSSAYGLSGDCGENELLIADPFADYAQYIATELLGFQVGKCSVSTSGQYVRKYTTDGVEYSHIIDGATGKPAQTGIISVTVVVPESNGYWAGKSDCLTTALTVMGKEKAVEYINGYLKEQEITVVIVYETIDGKRQILSNIDESRITSKGANYETYSWGLKKNDDGNFEYVGAESDSDNIEKYKTVVIILGVALLAAVVALVVYMVVRGRKNIRQTLITARSDKPFKIADIGIYIAVLLLIAVLFEAFVVGGQTSEKWTTVQVVDMETGEQLFFFNRARDEYTFNEQNSSGWTAEISQTDSGLQVTLSRQIDGETHYNTFVISYGDNSVGMTDALCGYHRDCVNSFGAVTNLGGVIVCSPNRLKIVTQ